MRGHGPRAHAVRRAHVICGDEQHTDEGHLSLVAGLGFQEVASWLALQEEVGILPEFFFFVLLFAISPFNFTGCPTYCHLGLWLQRQIIAQSVSPVLA